MTAPTAGAGTHPTTPPPPPRPVSPPPPKISGTPAVPQRPLSVASGAGPAGPAIGTAPARAGLDRPSTPLPGASSGQRGSDAPDAGAAAAPRRVGRSFTLPSPPAFQVGRADYRLLSARAVQQSLDRRGR